MDSSLSVANVAYVDEAMIFYWCQYKDVNGDPVGDGFVVCAEHVPEQKIPDNMTLDYEHTLSSGCWRCAYDRRAAYGRKGQQ